MTAMTTPTQAQIEALELIDTFAWSCVKTDCEESRIELQRRIDKCRAALTAAVEAGQSDKCANCGYPKAEHHHEGACYGLCGEFVSAAETDIRFREFGSGATWVDFPMKDQP